jgi:RNA polymerase sigma factor
MDRDISELDLLVIEIQNDIHTSAFEQLVRDYTPFIVSCVSNRLGRYVAYENDAGYSVALSAFQKSVEKYDLNKGSFINFAKLLIDRDLINHIKALDPIHESIDMLTFADYSKQSEEELALKEEIESFEKELLHFGLNFDDLVENSPKHADTRATARDIAIKTYQERNFVEHLFKKKRLPVSKMCLKFRITKKTIYGSYDYIIAIVIIFEKKFEHIKNWI